MEDAQPATAVPDASNEEYAAFLAAAAAREKEEQVGALVGSRRESCEGRSTSAAAAG